MLKLVQGIPGGSDGKESACNVGDLGSIPGSGRSPGEGNGNPLQYSCLENPMDRVAWGLQSMGCKDSNMAATFTYVCTLNISDDISTFILLVYLLKIVSHLILFYGTNF